MLRQNEPAFLPPFFFLWSSPWSLRCWDIPLHVPTKPAPPTHFLLSPRSARARCFRFLHTLVGHESRAVPMLTLAVFWLFPFFFIFFLPARYAACPPPEPAPPTPPFLFFFCRGPAPLPDHHYDGLSWSPLIFFGLARHAILPVTSWPPHILSFRVPPSCHLVPSWIFGFSRRSSRTIVGCRPPAVPLALSTQCCAAPEIRFQVGGARQQNLAHTIGFVDVTN